MARLYPLLLPKWGLEMQEGTLLEWRVAEGAVLQRGDEIVDIETSKVTNTLESPLAGVLRRRVGEVSRTYSCGTLIAVICEPDVTNEEIESFVKGFSVDAKEVARDPETQTRMVEVDSVSLRVLQQGSGKVPVLLLHGLSGDLSTWMRIQSELSATHATVSVDLPGHGGSSKHCDSVSSFSDVARLLLSLMTELGIDEAHLVAHSMSAPIAMAMAHLSGARVRSMVLLAPAGFGSPVKAEFLEGLSSARTRKEMQGVLRLLFKDESRATRELAENLLRYKRLDGVAAALGKYRGILERETGSGAPVPTPRPMTVIWGREDRVIGMAPASSRPTDVEFAVVEDSGHMPHLEGYAETVRVIRGHLSRYE